MAKQRPRSSARRSLVKAASTTKALFPPNAYYAHTVPGLEEVAWREVKRKFPTSALLGFKTMGERNGVLVFKFEDDPFLLLKLHTVEDVFLLIASLKKLPAGRKSLEGLTRLAGRQIDWPLSLRIHRAATGYRPKPGRQTTFRVISRVLGRHPFHRKEAQSRVEKAIQRTNSRWLLVDDYSTLELWLNIFDKREVMLGLRLSDKSMRHRSYKLEHLPASLKPTVAAAMVLLSDPQDENVFLDPMCGAGTLLIERAVWGPYQQLLGGDIRREAVAATLANIENKYKPVEIQRWDATKLATIPSNSVDKVVCNLPFGRQIGSQTENQRLYGQFLTEMARVVRAGGYMVLLTGDFNLLSQKLRTTDTFKVLEIVSLTLLGVRAKIFVLVRQPGQLAQPFSMR